MARTLATTETVTVSDNAAYSALSTITVAFWHKTSAVSLSDTPVEKWGTVAGNQEFIFKTTTSGAVRMRFIINNGTETITSQDGSAISNGTWIYWAGTYDSAGPTTAIYRNAVQTDTDTGTTNAALQDGASNLILNSAAQGESLGDYAELAIWNVVLTATELLMAQKFGANRVRRTSLVLYLPLLGNGSPEPDFSGNALNGTLSGTTVANHPPMAPPFGFDWGWQGNIAAAAGGFVPFPRPRGEHAGMLQLTGGMNT